jgi:hypothetical protein
MGFNPFGLIGKIFGIGGKDKPKPDPYAAFTAQLQPYLEQQKKISQNAFESGTSDIGSGREGINKIIDYYNNFLNGSREDILKNVDSSAVTASYDQAAGNLANFGVRGGRSAGQLAGLEFDKASALNKIVQDVRNKAPEELANLYNMLMGLGQNELATSLGASGANINSLFSIQELKDAKIKADADRKAAIIASIFGAAGGAAGTYFGSK